MAIVDAFGNRCDPALTLHVRKIHRIEFDVLAPLRHAQASFGKYSIMIQLGSLESVNMDKRSHARLAVVEPALHQGTSSPEQTELYERFGVQDLQSVTAFLVHDLTQPPNSPLPRDHEIAGVASHLPHRPAIFFQRQVNSTTIAHELGHVPMEAEQRDHHTTERNNVMRSGLPYAEYAITLASPRFTAPQLLIMRRSPLCARVRRAGAMATRILRCPLLRALILSTFSGACSPPAPPSPTQPPPISEERAKQLAVDHFNGTFAGHFHLRDPSTGACGAIPEIRVDHIASARLQADSWLIERTPLVGFVFAIRVARNGSWTAVEKAYAASE